LTVSAPQSAARGLWNRVHRILRSEQRTDPYVAAILAQILMLSDEFDDALLRRGLDPRDKSGRDTILIARENYGGFVLLVADVSLVGVPEPEEESVTVGRAAFSRALGRWRLLMDARIGRPGREEPRGAESRDLEKLTAFLTDRDFDTLALASCSVMFVERPRMIVSSCPSPAWCVVPMWPVVVTPAGIATAGCLVQHDDGRWGVTSVRHLFTAVTPIVGTHVTVDGLPGIVAAEDAVTDSVFIEMPNRPSPANAFGTGGYLSGIAPRMLQSTQFDGATSGLQSTAINGMDPTVTWVSPISQTKVYTPAVTNPGDSGAALVEQGGTDQIIAFAHERTPPGAPVEWSTWIWAASVFSALKVKPA
jgi:hypothetical protein